MRTVHARMAPREVAARIHVGDDPELALLRALVLGPLTVADAEQRRWPFALIRQTRHGHVETRGDGRVYLTDEGRRWVLRVCRADVRRWS